MERVGMQSIINIVNQFATEHNIKIRYTSTYEGIAAYFPDKDMVLINHSRIFEFFRSILEEKPEWDWKKRLLETLNHELKHKEIYQINKLYFPYSMDEAILTGVEDYYIDNVLGTISIEESYLKNQIIINRERFIKDLMYWFEEGDIRTVFCIAIAFSYGEIDTYIPKHASFFRQFKPILEKVKSPQDIPSVFKEVKPILWQKFGATLRFY